MCTEGFAPGYSHTCKSCLGDNTRRAVGVMLGISVLVLAVLGLVVCRLVSVVEMATERDTKGKVSFLRRRQSRWRRVQNRISPDLARVSSALRTAVIGGVDTNCTTWECSTGTALSGVDYVRRALDSCIDTTGEGVNLRLRSSVIGLARA